MENKIKKNHVYGFSRLKAILLAGTMTLGLGACGRTVESTPGANVSIETQTNPSNTKENNTTENITTTVTPANPQTSVYYPDDNTTQYTEVVPVDVQTSVYYPTTENPTYTINPSQPQTSVHNPVSGNKTTTKVKNTDIKVTTTRVNTQNPTTTKKVTTAKPTTQKVTTTTVRVTQPPVTQPPRTDFNKYDLLSSDPSEAAKAFEKLADELRNDLFKGWMIDDVNGISGGQNHAKVILALLNYNQGISPEALGTDIALGKYSLDDIIYYSQMMNLPQTQKRYGKTIDFNKYVIDENFANYLEEITSKYYEFQNGNAEPIIQLMKQYGETHDVITLSNISNYTELCITFFVEDEMDNYDETGDRNLFNEQVIVPMYESYEQYKGYSYNR